MTELGFVLSLISLVPESQRHTISSLDAMIDEPLRCLRRKSLECFWFLATLISFVLEKPVPTAQDTEQLCTTKHKTQDTTHKTQDTEQHCTTKHKTQDTTHTTQDTDNDMI